MIKEYKEYLKDNSQGYWFRARWYGWGWVPARPKGWATLIIWASLVLFFAFTIDENSSTTELMVTFILPITLLTIALISICWKKGERPQWNWGDPRKKDRS